MLDFIKNFTMGLRH